VGLSRLILLLDLGAHAGAGRAPVVQFGELVHGLDARPVAHFFGLHGGLAGLAGRELLLHRRGRGVLPVLEGGVGDFEVGERVGGGGFLQYRRGLLCGGFAERFFQAGLGEGFGLDLHAHLA
jgi:hypothetical protein